MGKILRAERIYGRYLVLRHVQREDANFILALRQDPVKGRYLNPTSPELEDQVKYISAYYHSTDSAYFIIQDRAGEPCGTVRLYDPREDSFSWGSWILRDGLPFYYAMECILILYNYATQCLGFKRAHFDVRKENRKVLDFHRRYGAVVLSEDELNYYLEVSADKMASFLSKNNKFLQDPIVVREMLIPASG